MSSELAGTTVLLTRDDLGLARALADRGAAVVTLPCVRIEPADRASLVAELGRLSRSDVLLLTSRAGVEAVARVAELRALPSAIAAIGPATAAALRARGRKPDFVSSRPTGADLGRELALPDGEIVLARSDRALAELPDVLRRRGARVREVVAYRTRAEADGDVDAARNALAAGAAIVFASPSAVEGLVRAVGDELPRRARIVAIGPTTAAAVRQLIGVNPLVAALPTAASIVDLFAEGSHVAHR